MTEQMTKDFTEFCNFVKVLLATKDYELQVDPGRKYLRLWMVQGSHRSAWAFVDKTTGEIFKPATWRAPAKHARGNINNQPTYLEYRWTGPHYLR